jgi:uncharacterized protein YicC (UPF0701 family)
VSVEIRGVNQRFLDVKVTLPREYAAWESEVRERVRGAAERGRVDVSVTRTPVASRRRYRVGVRDELAERYVDCRPPARAAPRHRRRGHDRGRAAACPTSSRRARRRRRSSPNAPR